MFDIVYVDQATFFRYRQKIEKLENQLKEIEFKKGELATHLQKGDDWHENPVLSQLEMEEEMTRINLRKLKEEFNRIIVTDSSEDGIVQVGKNVTVLLIDEDGDEEKLELLLVASMPTANTNEISKDSPLGTAILGKKLNDTVSYIVSGSWSTPDDFRIYRENGYRMTAKILEIS